MDPLRQLRICALMYRDLAAVANDEQTREGRMALAAYFDRTADELEQNHPHCCCCRQPPKRS